MHEVDKISKNKKSRQAECGNFAHNLRTWATEARDDWEFEVSLGYRVSSYVRGTIQGWELVSAGRVLA